MDLADFNLPSLSPDALVEFETRLTRLLQSLHEKLSLCLDVSGVDSEVIRRVIIDEFVFGCLSVASVSVDFDRQVTTLNGRRLTRYSNRSHRSH